MTRSPAEANLPGRRHTEPTCCGGNSTRGRGPVVARRSGGEAGLLRECHVAPAPIAMRGGERAIAVKTGLTSTEIKASRPFR